MSPQAWLRRTQALRILWEEFAKHHMTFLMNRAEISPWTYLIMAIFPPLAPLEHATRNHAFHSIALLQTHNWIHWYCKKNVHRDPDLPLGIRKPFATTIKQCSLRLRYWLRSPLWKKIVPPAALVLSLYVLDQILDLPCLIFLLATCMTSNADSSHLL